MDNIISRTIFPLLPPVSLLLAFHIYFLRVDLGEMTLLVNYISYTLFVAGMLLGIWFNSGRVFFTMVILATSQYFTMHFKTGDAVADAGIFNLVALLIPLNILIFSFLGERGIFSLWGKIRMGFIFTQVLACICALSPENTALVDLIAHKPALLEKVSVFNMPNLATLAFALTLTVLIIRQLIMRSFLESSFIVATFALAVGLNNHIPGSPALPYYFGAAGALLVIAIIHKTYRMAYMDDLTKLPARRSLKENMMQLSGKYVIAMLDIDFFKKFNDKYGHDVGDDALRFVASIIKGVTGGGKPFRYGGEEFTILFPGKNLHEALPHLEELRANIARRKFIIRSKNRPAKRPQEPNPGNMPVEAVNITVSIGAAERSELARAPEEVIKAADIALYRAKKKGRNCISK